MSRIRLPREARQSPVPPTEAPFDPTAIQALLQHAVVDILDGSPAGPLFATRVQRVCREALSRAGIQGRVTTENGGQHAIVWVRVGKRVERVSVVVEVR